MATTKGNISMKLLIDNTNRKVLFAEAGKEGVDFIFHILSLPLGTVVRFLSKESMPGSLGNIYGSLESLNTNYLQDGLNKDCLLNPKPASGSASDVPLLTVKPAASPDPGAKTFFTFGGQMNQYQGVTFGAPPAPVKKIEESGGGYVKGGAMTYMIMDDLSVQPMSTISSITLLNKFNVQDVGRLEEKEVTLDMNLGVALLKESLVSKTVLTDVFLARKSAARSI